MKSLDRKIIIVRAWLILVLYATLALFCLLLVMASIQLWPYQSDDTSGVLVVSHAVIGLFAMVTGFRFTLILRRRLHHFSKERDDEQTLELGVGELLYLPHLLPMAIFFVLTNILFGL